MFNNHKRIGLGSLALFIPLGLSISLLRNSEVLGWSVSVEQMSLLVLAILIGHHHSDHRYAKFGVKLSILLLLVYLLFILKNTS